MKQLKDISLIFNVADLYEFHEGTKDGGEGNMDGWKAQLPTKPVEEQEKILAKRVIKRTRKDEYLEYLVKWRNQGIGDASWVSEEELAHLRGSPSFTDNKVIYP